MLIFFLLAVWRRRERTLLGGQTFILRADYIINIIALAFVGMQFLLSLGQVAGLSRSQ